MFARTFSTKFGTDKKDGASSPPSFLSRAVSSLSLSMAGIDREESDTADHEESLANEVTMSSILDAGVSSDCSVDSFLLNGELTDSSGTVLLAQENLLTDNFSSLFETDSIFQGMCGSARGVHAAIRLVKLESHLVLERTHDAPPTVIAGFPTASALISSLAGSRGDVPAEGEIKQLASKLRSVVDLLSDDQAQYLQAQEARTGVSFDTRVLELLGTAVGSLLRCVPKRAEAVELVSLLDELNDSQASRDAPRAKEVERRRAAVLRLAQQRARLQVLCCQQLTGPACGILGKLNIARTLSAGRISEAALCAVCFLAMSSSLGRERLIAAGVCELLLQTGREHSDIEAVAEWVCRAVSALCSVGGIPGRSSGTASDGPSDNVLQRVLAASVGRELSIGERGRGRLVELGAIHMLLTRLIAEHVSPWLSRQRLPNRQAAAVATPPRRASRKSSFTGHLLLLLEGSVIIDCICLGLYCLCYQNQVYKRMLQSAQGSPVHSSRYVDNDHGLLAAEDTIGGLHSIFKWVAHRCQVIGSLMEAGAGAEDQTAQCGSYRNILVLPLSVDTSQPAGDAPVCVTMTWIWRLVASLAAYDHSVRTEEDVESVGGGTGSLSTGRRSSMGTSSIYSAQSTSSAKALLGSLGVGEALVASLRCCGTASQGMARAAFSAVGAVCLGSRRNQIQLVDSGMPVISVEVLQFHWDAYREQRTNLLALNDIHIEMDVCNETSSGRLRDAEESFEGLLREACIALKALCQDSEAAASRLTESTLCSLLMTIMQYCFELEGGARPISYLWYLVATLLTHRDLRVSLVADHNICTFLSMSMKLHGVNQDVAIWLATASIDIARDPAGALALGRAGGCGGLAQLLRIHSQEVAVLTQTCFAIAEMSISVPTAHTGWFGGAGVCESLCAGLEDIFVFRLEWHAARFTANRLKADSGEEQLPTLTAQHINAALSAGIPFPSLEALAEAASMCLASLSSPLGNSDFAKMNGNCLRLCSARVFTVLTVLLRPEVLFVNELSTQSALSAVRNITQYFVQLYQLHVAPYRPRLGVEHSIMQSVVCGVPRRRALCVSIGCGDKSFSEDVLSGALENIFYDTQSPGGAVSQGLRALLMNRSRAPSSDSIASFTSPKAGKHKAGLSPLSSAVANMSAARPRLLSNVSNESNQSSSSKRSALSMLSPGAPMGFGVPIMNNTVGIPLKWNLELLGHVHTGLPFHSVFSTVGRGIVGRRVVYEDDDAGEAVHSIIESNPADRAGAFMTGIGDVILCHVIKSLSAAIYDKQAVVLGCQASVLLLIVRCSAVRLRIRDQSGRVATAAPTPTQRSLDSSNSPQPNTVGSPLVTSQGESPVHALAGSGSDHDELFRRYKFGKEGVVGARASAGLLNVLVTHLNDKGMVEAVLRLASYALTLINNDGLPYYLLADGVTAVLVQMLARHIDSEAVVVLTIRLISNGALAYSNLYPPHPMYHGSYDSKRDKCAYQSSAGSTTRRLNDVYYSAAAAEAAGSGACYLHAMLSAQRRVLSTASGDSRIGEPDDSPALINPARRAMLYGLDGIGGQELCEGLVGSLMQHPDSPEAVKHVFACIAAVIRPFSVVAPLIGVSGQEVGDRARRTVLNQNLFTDLGLCEIVPRLLRAHMTSVDVVVSGCAVVCNLCSESGDLTQRLIDSPDAVGVLISCLDLHKAEPVAVEWIVRTLTTLSTAPNYHCATRLGALGVCEVVVGALVRHCANAEVALQCCLALGNLSSYSPAVYMTNLPHFMRQSGLKHNAQLLLLETPFLVAAKKALAVHIDAPSVVAACLRAVYYVTLHGSRATHISGRRESVDGTATRYDDAVDLSGLQTVVDSEEGLSVDVDEVDADPDDVFIIPFKAGGLAVKENSTTIGVDLYPLHGLIAEAMRIYSGYASYHTITTNNSGATNTAGVKASRSMDLLVCEWACLAVCLSTQLSPRCRDAYTYTLGDGESDLGVIEALACILGMPSTMSGSGGSASIGAVSSFMSGVWSSFTVGGDGSGRNVDGKPYLPAYGAASAASMQDVPIVSLDAYVSPGTGCIGCHTGSLLATSDLSASLSEAQYASAADIDRGRFELDYGRWYRVVRFACLAIHTLCTRPPTYHSTQLSFRAVCQPITRLLSRWGERDVALARAALKALAALSDVLCLQTIRPSIPSVLRVDRSSTKVVDTEPTKDLMLFNRPIVVGTNDSFQDNLEMRLSAQRLNVIGTLEFEDDDLGRSRTESDSSSPDWMPPARHSEIERELARILSEVDGINGPGDESMHTMSAGRAKHSRILVNDTSGDHLGHGHEEDDFIMDGGDSSSSSSGSPCSLYESSGPGQTIAEPHSELMVSNSYDEFLVRNGTTVDDEYGSYGDVESMSAHLMMRGSRNYGHCGGNQDLFDDAGAVKVLLHLMYLYSSQPESKLAIHLFRALESLVSHSHFNNASTCSSSTAVSSIIAGMQSNLCSRGISGSGSGILMNLLNAVDVSVSSSSSGNGTNAVVASLLGGMGACEAIIEALDRYSMDVILCEKAICALSSLSEDLKGTGAWIGHTGGCRALLSAMQRHPTNAAIVKAGWAAVLNIARDVTCRSRFGSCGACELAHSTLETYFIKGASMNGLVGAEIGVLSLKVLGRLCEEIGGNCRRVIADNVCASLLTCINAAGAAITKGVSTGAITHESCSLVTSLAHYIRATNSRDAANGLINELVVSSGLLSVLLRAVCHDVTAANVCEAGCHMVAMVVAENPLAQGEMTCTIGVTAGIRCGCDLMVHVLRHHAWMEGVCAACSLAIFAICDGNSRNQAAMGQNGSAALLVNFAMEHIEIEPTLTAVLAALESLAAHCATNGLVLQTAGVAAMLTECFSIYGHKRDARRMIAALLSCAKVMLLANINIARPILVVESPHSPSTKTAFITLLVKAMNSYTSADEVSLLGCDVLSLLCLYDESEDEKIGPNPSRPIAKNFGMNAADECVAAGMVEALLGLLDKHSSALGHAQYIDQLKRHQAAHGRLISVPRSHSGHHIATYAEPAQFASDQRGMGGVYSGIHYDMPAGTPEDDAYNALFESSGYGLRDVYLPQDRDSFYFAAKHIQTINSRLSEKADVSIQGTPSDKGSEEDRYLTLEKAAAANVDFNGVRLLPIDIMIVQAACRAVCQLCMRSPDVAARCLSLGMVKAINRSVAALFVSSSLAPSPECLMAKDLVLSSLNMKGIDDSLLISNS